MWGLPFLCLHHLLMLKPREMAELSLRLFARVSVGLPSLCLRHLLMLKPREMAKLTLRPLARVSVGAAFSMSTSLADVEAPGNA